MDNIREERKAKKCIFCRRYFEPNGRHDYFCPKCTPMAQTLRGVFCALIGGGIGYAYTEMQDR